MYKKLRLYDVIRGWRARWESWLPGYGCLAGETDRNEVWNNLAQLVRAGMDGVAFAMTLSDAGYRLGRMRMSPLSWNPSGSPVMCSLWASEKSVSLAMKMPAIPPWFFSRVGGALMVACKAVSSTLLRLDGSALKIASRPDHGTESIPRSIVAAGQNEFDEVRDFMWYSGPPLRTLDRYSQQERGIAVKSWQRPSVMSASGRCAGLDDLGTPPARTIGRAH